MRFVQLLIGSGDLITSAFICFLVRVLWPVAQCSRFPAQMWSHSGHPGLRRGTRADAKHVWEALRGLESPERERRLIHIVQDPSFTAACPCVCAIMPVNLQAAHCVRRILLT